MSSSVNRLPASWPPDFFTVETIRLKTIDITIYGGVEKGSAAWTYVMVTNKRLRWVPHARLRLEASLDFDNVTAASETTLHHRYAITLSRGPAPR